MLTILTRMKDFTVDGFNGLAKTEPVLAITAVVFLLSLTGIPLTAGFQAKFYMLVAAVKHTSSSGHYFWLIILAVLCAAISAYYYFRIIQAMFFKESNDAGGHVTEAGNGFKLLLVVTAILIIALGLQPERLTDWLYYHP